MFDSGIYLYLRTVNAVDIIIHYQKMAKEKFYVVWEGVTPREAFAKTEEKIDNSFACGYGTVLFFEDQKVVKGLQEAFPSYQENFPGWSLQTSAMHQLAVWVMLEDVTVKISGSDCGNAVRTSCRQTG